MLRHGDVAANNTDASQIQVACDREFVRLNLLEADDDENGPSCGLIPLELAQNKR